jgi:hypothetical protein
VRTWQHGNPVPSRALSQAEPLLHASTSVQVPCSHSVAIIVGRMFALAARAHAKLRHLSRVVERWRRIS